MSFWRRLLGRPREGAPTYESRSPTSEPYVSPSPVSDPYESKSPPSDPYESRTEPAWKEPAGGDSGGGS